MLHPSLSRQGWCGQVSSRQHSSICCSITTIQQRTSVSYYHPAPVSLSRHSLRGGACLAQHQPSQQQWSNRGHRVTCSAASAEESAQAAAQQAQDAGIHHSSADLQVRQSSSGSSRSSSLSSMDDGMSVHLADAGAAALALTATAAASQSSQPHSAPLTVPAALAEVAKFNEETESVNRLDIYKAIGVGGAVGVLAGVLEHEWVSSRRCLSLNFQISTQRFTSTFTIYKSNDALLSALGLRQW